MSDLPAPHRVEAFNIAAASENKIHDDTVASRFGFTGGLVPGVAVFGYMAHLPVARWGRDWLERGTADCRFGQPVYDGRVAVASAVEGDFDAMRIEVRSEDRLCATGNAALLPAEAAPDIASWTMSTIPPTEERPAADTTSLAEGRRIGTRPFVVSRTQARQWHADLRETDPVFEREQVLHPATLLRLANWVLTQNVRLGPWIHVGSRVRNHAVLPVGATLTARGIVRRNHEEKGHKIVELDLLVLVDERQVAAHIEHTAIYVPRQVAEAARSKG